MNSVKVAVFLAFKSMTRGDWRVLLLTISMLILVYLNLVFTPALLAGAVQDINEKTRDTLSGDIVVQSDNYPVIFGAQQMVSRTSQIFGVAGACARNSLGAEIRHQGERFITAIYAIDPAQDSGVFDISEKIVDGSYLEAGDRDQVLLGVQIAGNDWEELELYASSLKTVHAGDKVTIYYGSDLGKEYTVKGRFFTEFVQSDIRAYITEDEFETLVPQMKDRATSIHVKLKPHVDRESVMEQIQSIRILGIRQPLKFQTWEDALGVMRSMTKSFDQIIAILRTIALIVAAITIFIVTYVDLVNKRRQIGIERAIGITSVSIVSSYVIRAVIYAVLSILAAALIFVYVVVPIEALYPFHFPFGDVLLPVDVSYLTSSGLILCAVAVASAFVPAWQTIRTKIIDAIWSS